MRRRIPLACLVIAAHTACAVAFDFPNDTLTLENPTMTIKVAPSLGRILVASASGKKNWLSLDDAFVAEATRTRKNQPGGDGVLFSPISLWDQYRRPRYHDPAAYDLPWTVVQQSPHSVTLRSERCDDLGVRMWREITIDPERPRLRQRYHLVREVDNPFPVHVWALSRVPVDGELWMDIAPGSRWEDAHPYRYFVVLPEPDGAVEVIGQNDALRFHWPQDQVGKVGTYGSWLAQKTGDNVFLQASRWQPGQPYIDRSNLQIFVRPGDDGFCELENQSPTVWLQPGESITFELYWTFLTAPPQASGKVDFARYCQEQADALMSEAEQLPRSPLTDDTIQ